MRSDVNGAIQRFICPFRAINLKNENYYCEASFMKPIAALAAVHRCYPN